MYLKHSLEEVKGGYLRNIFLRKIAFLKLTVLIFLYLAWTMWHYPFTNSQIKEVLPLPLPPLPSLPPSPSSPAKFGGLITV